MRKGTYIRTKEIIEKNRKASIEYFKTHDGTFKGKTFSMEHRERISAAKIKKYRYRPNIHPSWKGGKYRSIKGYVFIKKYEHPFCDCRGYIHEHRLVMEKILGRYLDFAEEIHHKGTKYPMGSAENKSDNRPENLQLFPSRSAHIKFHFSQPDHGSHKTRFKKGHT